jgi:hypothetical protein
MYVWSQLCMMQCPKEKDKSTNNYLQYIIQKTTNWARWTQQKTGRELSSVCAPHEACGTKTYLNLIEVNPVQNVRLKSIMHEEDEP